MSFINPLIGYVSAILVASLLLLASMFVEFIVFAPSIAVGIRTSISDGLHVALFFWVYITATMAVVMIVPCLLVVLAYRGLPYDGRKYFAACGAGAGFLVGCVTSSLSPKPLFIEDQTFFQGFMIAAERQGIPLLLAGLAGGFTYWFIAERKRSNPTHAVAPERR